MRVDLHTHTTASDGKLPAAELIRNAAASGVDMLSITDHDTTEAYAQLGTANSGSMMLIPGIEFSTRWRRSGIHVIGLNVELSNDAIREGVAFQSQARADRAESIAAVLEKLGIDVALPRVQEIAGVGMLGRPHFAQHLVETGVVGDMAQAFNKYLGSGKPGDVRQHWAPLSRIIDWIRGSGGIAVLAHPAKYKLTNTKLLTLIDDFRAAGGQAMEVVSGRQDPSLTRHLAAICEQKELLASCGSDFHRPGQNWAELGRCPVLPETCIPVWDEWYEVAI